MLSFIGYFSILFRILWGPNTPFSSWKLCSRYGEAAH